MNSKDAKTSNNHTHTWCERHFYLSSWISSSFVHFIRYAIAIIVNKYASTSDQQQQQESLNTHARTPTRKKIDWLCDHLCGYGNPKNHKNVLIMPCIERVSRKTALFLDFSITRIIPITQHIEWFSLIRHSKFHYKYPASSQSFWCGRIRSMRSSHWIRNALLGCPFVMLWLPHSDESHRTYNPRIKKWKKKWILRSMKGSGKKSD